jgi:hypothetical protein
MPREVKQLRAETASCTVQVGFSQQRNCRCNAILLVRIPKGLQLLHYPSFSD